MADLERLSINQVTMRERWSLAEAISGLARHDIRGIAVWRDKLGELGVDEAARRLRGEGMTVTAFCVGGLLGVMDDTSFQERLDDNRRVIDQAAVIQAECVMMVAGGLPEGSRDLTSIRERCLEGLDALMPYAKQAGVTLALEPLHPMTAASRSCLTTLRQANDWYEQLGGGAELGIAVDVYHVWWDPDLERQISRAKDRIVAFHVSDWLMETVDLRLDRGMMGDGVIDIPHIRALVEKTGYTGLIEVEVFSERNWWQRDPDEAIGIIKQRFSDWV
ncbi:MAG: sugar phosphate isomerase/epimerase family protein [Geminicoccaceae bacterium]